MTVNFTYLENQEHYFDKFYLSAIKLHELDQWKTFWAALYFQTLNKWCIVQGLSGRAPLLGIQFRGTIRNSQTPPSPLNLEVGSPSPPHMEKVLPVHVQIKTYKITRALENWASAKLITALLSHWQWKYIAFFSVRAFINAWQPCTNLTCKMIKMDYVIFPIHFYWF